MVTPSLAVIYGNLFLNKRTGKSNWLSYFSQSVIELVVLYQVTFNANVPVVITSNFFWLVDEFYPFSTTLIISGVCCDPATS